MSTDTPEGAAILKPCPFCNVESAYLQLQKILGPMNNPIWNVDCTRCNARGPTDSSDDGAIIKWNNLISDARIAALEAENAELRKALTLIGTARNGIGRKSKGEQWCIKTARAALNTEDEQ